MNTIRLYGALGKEFGTRHRFDIASTNEAIEALAANFPRFLAAIRHGFYRVIVGKTTRNGVELDEAMLPGFKLGQQALHIVPVAKGRKRGGLGKIVAGIALIGLSMMTGGAVGALMATGFAGGTVGTMVGSVGMGMMVAGVSSMLAPEIDGTEHKQSFTMTGPQSTAREGGIVPIAYGTVWTGGVLINGAISIRGNDVPLGDTTEEIFLGLADS